MFSSVQEAASPVMITKEDHRLRFRRDCYFSVVMIFLNSVVHQYSLYVLYVLCAISGLGPDVLVRAGSEASPVMITKDHIDYVFHGIVI